MEHLRVVGCPTTRTVPARGRSGQSGAPGRVPRLPLADRSSRHTPPRSKERDNDDTYCARDADGDAIGLGVSAFAAAPTDSAKKPMGINAREHRQAETHQGRVGRVRHLLERIADILIACGWRDAEDFVERRHQGQSLPRPSRFRHCGVYRVGMDRRQGAGKPKARPRPQCLHCPRFHSDSDGERDGVLHSRTRIEPPPGAPLTRTAEALLRARLLRPYKGRVRRVRFRRTRHRMLVAATRRTDAQFRECESREICDVFFRRFRHEPAKIHGAGSPVVGILKSLLR